MFAIQQRRERVNRQINERLRVLIAAYKTLGRSFTGDLAVDPRHRRDQRRPTAALLPTEAPSVDAVDLSDAQSDGSDRTRRIRDAVEAALSDIILLGTEAQVVLAAKAATELVEGKLVHTHQLVLSLRDFIRDALDLDPVPATVKIPPQGPTRPASGAGGRGKGDGDGGRQGRGSGAGAVGLGEGMGLGAGLGGADAHEILPATHTLR